LSVSVSSAFFRVQEVIISEPISCIEAKDESWQLGDTGDEAFFINTDATDISSDESIRVCVNNSTYR
jgi:hypothetical protein